MQVCRLPQLVNAALPTPARRRRRTMRCTAKKRRPSGASRSATQGSATTATARAIRMEASTVSRPMKLATSCAAGRVGQAGGAGQSVGVQASCGASAVPGPAATRPANAPSPAHPLETSLLPAATAPAPSCSRGRKPAGRPAGAPAPERTAGWCPGRARRRGPAVCSGRDDSRVGWCMLRHCPWAITQDAGMPAPQLTSSVAMDSATSAPASVQDAVR